MSVPQQLTQVSIFRTGYPHPRKAILQQQLQQQGGIQTVCLLLSHPLGLDLRRIPDPQLEPQFRQQPLEPARMSGRLHPHSHLAACCLQLAIELLGFSIAVTQSPFSTFSGVSIYKRDLLNARVIVHTYNPHIGSFLPSLGSSTNQSLLGGRGGRHCYEIKWIRAGPPTRTKPLASATPKE